MAGAVLEGRAEILTTEQLRFSKSEVARFFNLRLSRRQLASEVERSVGWPFALRISRGQWERGAEGGTGIARDLVENWIESRLFAGLARDDRDFLLDVGLFDWLDAALLDEVLQRVDSMHRLESMRVLAGLLEPVGSGAAGSRRLHPLVRRHCAERRRRENPQRFRAVSRRIAEALARRGDTVSAVRHAVDSGDPELAGRILERAAVSSMRLSTLPPFRHPRSSRSRGALDRPGLRAGTWRAERLHRSSPGPISVKRERSDACPLHAPQPDPAHGPRASASR